MIHCIIVEDAPLARRQTKELYQQSTFTGFGRHL